MKPTFLLCASLAIPVGALAPGAVAAPANKPAAIAAAVKDIAQDAAPTRSHAEGDGHEHEAPTAPDGPTDELWRRSDDAFHAGDFPRAVELHREIVKIDPSDVESYGVAAWLLWSMEKGDEANAFIAQGLKNNPDSSAMWETAGDQYGLEKRAAPERDAYAKSILLAGAGADQMLRRRYAHAAEHAGDLPASVMAWRALAKDFPDEAVNKNNLARVEAQIKAAGAKTPIAPAGFVGLGALSLLGIGAWKRARQA